MSQIYKNALEFNNGLSIVGSAPTDDRTVWSSKSDIYVDSTNAKDAPMFNKIYKGMTVTIYEDEKPNLYVCVNAEPYTPGFEIDVTEENYKDYWSPLAQEYNVNAALDAANEKIEELTLDTSTRFEELTLDTSTRIYDATYFNSDGDDNTETLEKHGNLKKGITMGELKQMTISEILQRILFETVDAKLKTNLSASCSLSSYSAVQEIGANMPTASNISISFQPEVYACTTSSGSTVATYSLNKINNSNTVKYYNASNNSNNNGDDMNSAAYKATKFVSPGTHYFYADVAYDAYQDAKNSDGVLKKAGYAGNIKTSPVSFKGVYKIFTNAAYIYNELTTAWDARYTVKPNWVADTKTAGPLMNDTVTTYLNWPNGTKTEDVFYIYVPTGHSITSIKAANNTAPLYDGNATATKQSGTITINTTNGNDTGEYDVYVVSKAVGLTNVEVVIK